MKKFLMITTTVALFGMLAVSASAQKVTGVGTTPGYASSSSSTPGINNANRRYDAPRVDYRIPAPFPSDRDRYGRNDDRRDDRRDDRDRNYRNNNECSNDRDRGYTSNRGGRWNDDHHNHDKHCTCGHHGDRDDRNYRSGRNDDYRDRNNRGYVDYRDRDRYNNSRGSCSNNGKGRSR